MHVQVPHKFGKQQALARLKHALSEGRAKAGDQVTFHDERWEGDTLYFDITAQGQRISGSVAVNDADFDINAKLPLMLRMFEGKIERAIAEQAKQMLG